MEDNAKVTKKVVGDGQEKPSSFVWFWKALGGATLGVAAVAAAPFTGGGSILGAVTLAGSLAGAGTIAAATGAGLAGAATGVILSNHEEERKKEKLKESLDAKEALIKQQLASTFDKVMHSSTEHYEFIIAMHAVGTSVAWADGSMAPEEQQAIDEFISGASHAKLPEQVIQLIRYISENPPSIKTAFKLVSDLNLNEDELQDIDYLIDFVINSDNHVHDKEILFKEEWGKLRGSN